MAAITKKINIAEQPVIKHPFMASFGLITSSAN